MSLQYVYTTPAGIEVHCSEPHTYEQLVEVDEYTAWLEAQPWCDPDDPELYYTMGSPRPTWNF